MAMRSSIVALFLILNCSGCTSTFPVIEPGSRNPYTHVQLTDKIKSRVVSIQFIKDSTTTGSDVTVHEDSCSWKDPTTDHITAVATRNIKNISYRNYLLGTLEGFILGTVQGGLIGGCRGYLAEIFSSNSFALKGEFAGLGIGIGIVVGSLAGSVYGTIKGISVGHKNEYEFV